MNKVFFFEINLRNLLLIFFKYRKSKIIIFHFNKKKVFYQILLKKLDIEVYHNKNYHDSTKNYFKVKEIAVEKSNEIFEKHFCKTKFVENLKTIIDEDVIKLLLCKYSYTKLFETLKRINFINEKFGTDKKIIFFDFYIDDIFLDNLNLSNIIVHSQSYNNNFFASLKFYFFNKINLLFSNFNFKQTSFKKNEKKILLLNEEINLDNKLRSISFIVDNINNTKINFYHFAKNLKKDLKNFYQIKYKKFLNTKPEIIFFSQLRNCFKIIKKDKDLKKFYGLKFLLLNFIFLIAKNKLILDKYKFDLIITDNISANSLSLLSLAKKMNIKTLAYQYSFLQNPNPVMSYPSKYFCIFSQKFKKIFENKFCKPENIIVTNYIFTKNQDYKLDLIKNKIQDKFTIVYFDESMSYYPWDVNYLNDLRKIYHSFASFLDKNKNFTLLIKNQFIRNLPSKLFFDDKKIINCLENNSFLEIFLTDIKTERNLILPKMINNLANISISHNFGATAGFEFAYSGGRSIMIKEDGFSGQFDNVFKNYEIVFPSLEKALDRIIEYRNNLILKKSDQLGDWNKLLIKDLYYNKNGIDVDNFINSNI